MLFHHLHVWRKEGLVNSARTHFLWCYYALCNHSTLQTKRILYPVMDHQLALPVWKRSCLLSELSSVFWFYTTPWISPSRSSQFTKEGWSEWWGTNPLSARPDAALSVLYCHPIRALKERGPRPPLGTALSSLNPVPSLPIGAGPLLCVPALLWFSLSPAFSFRIRLGLNSSSQLTFFFTLRQFHLRFRSYCFLIYEMDMIRSSV